MKKLSIIIISLFLTKGTIAQKLDKKVSITLTHFKDQESPPTITNLNINQNGEIVTFFTQRFRGKGEFGNPLTYSQQLNKKFFEIKMEDIEYFPYFITFKHDLNLNPKGSAGNFYFSPRNVNTKPTFLKIPIFAKSVYPENLSFAGSMMDFLKSNPELDIERATYNTLKTDSDGVLKIKNSKAVTVSKDFRLQAKESGFFNPVINTHTLDYQDPKLVGLITREEKSFELSDGKMIQYLVKKDENDNYSPYKNNVFVVFDDKGKVLESYEEFQPFMTKFIKRLRVFNEKGEPAGVVYLFSSNQPALGKAPRNPVANDFYFYYFDNQGKKVISKKFNYGDNENKDNAFKPIFAVKSASGIKLLNANGFGITKKGAFFERIQMDNSGNITSKETFEAELYKSKFSNRADFIELEDVVFQDGKFYNISKAVSPGSENIESKSLGIGLSVINSDLTVEFNGEILNHQPVTHNGFLETVKFDNKNYVIYNISTAGSFIVDLKNYQSVFKVGTSNSSYSFWSTGRNFAIDKATKSAYFVFPESEKSIYIQKVNF